MKKIIIKFITNTIDSEELDRLRRWLDDEKHQQLFENYIKDYYDVHLLMVKPDITAAYRKVWAQIQQEEKPVKRLIPHWVKYVAAASIALVISTSYFVYNKLLTNPTEIVTSTIKVGTDKAILTLEDGTDITLEKGKPYVADNFNSNGEELIYDIKNTTDIKQEISYNYLTIPRGGQFHVQLSDGTEIWLNSETKLKYPKKFIEGTVREVELVYGEAYFDVSPSTNHQGTRFKVISQFQEVEVLGTEFNIKAYKDEINVYTTLVEGKVAVANSVSKEHLVPNQQSIVTNRTNTITITNIDVYSETSWKKGLFSFKGKPLKEIMRVLSRWYDIDVVFTTKELEKIKFNGVLSKEQNIEDILNTIQYTHFINGYEINDKKIIIK